MGNVNAVPVVSQVKSAIQASCGDMEGALQTQEDFSKQCVVVSQVRSAVEATFDPEAACRTQLEFLDNLENVADATPIVGHVKGAVHYSLGDTEKGDGCMKSASRTAAMVVTGVVTGRSGLLTAGGASALVAEGVTTLIDSTIHNECRPSSIIKTVRFYQKTARSRRTCKLCFIRF